MKKIILNFKKYVVENRVEFLVILAVLVLGGVLRLYRISEYMTFLGDEGRDAIIVRNLLTKADPILVGPGTSVGNMYLGPLYYYFMAPGLWLFNFSPVGPSIQVALLGVTTIWLVWYVTKKWFGKWGALVAAGLYAISPTIIIYSRSSWNPNIMPFFALLAMFSLWQIWANQAYKWFWVLGISLAFVLQSHYLGLILVPTIGVFWLMSLIQVIHQKEKRSKFIKFSFIFVAGFLILMSPLFIFDARHNWRNFLAMQEFFQAQSQMVSVGFENILYKIPQVTQQVIIRTLGGRDIKTGQWLLTIMAIPLILFFIAKERFSPQTKKNLYFVLAWLAISFVGLAFYRQEIYDHYFGFLFCAPFIFLGALTQVTLDYSKKWGKFFIGFLFIYLAFVSFKNSPLLSQPNGQMQRAKNVAQKIISESNGEEFNLAVIAKQNYEDGYQYFLEKENANILEINPENYEATVAEQLFVVCELPEEMCQPTSNPKAQIANFGWSKIDREWEEYGVFLYRLVPNR